MLGFYHSPRLNWTSQAPRCLAPSHAPTFYLDDKLVRQEEAAAAALLRPVQVNQGCHDKMAAA